MQVQSTIYIERGDEELELTVKGRYFPGDPGQAFGPVERCYPPQPEDVEVEELFLNGQPWTGTLTKDEQTKAEESLCDAGRES